MQLIRKVLVDYAENLYSSIFAVESDMGRCVLGMVLRPLNCNSV